VVEETPPACPSDQTEGLDASCQGTLGDYTNLVTDNCDPNPTVLQTPPSGTVVGGAVSPISVTLDASDASGNSTSCTITITLEDTDAPDIPCTDETVTADASCLATLADYTGIVSDNCDNAPSITQTPSAGSTIGLGAHTITLAATDDSGNSDNCTFTITVVLDSATLLAQPMFGIDQLNPVSKLDVNGGVTIGAGFSGVNLAPPDGLIVKGCVGIGTPNPTKSLDIAGDINVNGDFYKNGILVNGVPGPQGVQGEQGVIGLTGPTGSQGIQGETGEIGPQGIQGIQGEIGLTGPEGPQGPVGPQGTMGHTGPAGDGDTWTTDTTSGNTYNVTGNIGIATTTPDALLDVNGSISVSGKTSPTSGEQLEVFWLNSEAYLESYNYDASQYRPINFIASIHEFGGGNVGIGVSAPDALLDVNGSISISGRTAATSGEQLEVFWLNSEAYFESYNYDASEYRPINYTASKHIFGAGNVGLGTTSPGNLLELNTDGAAGRGITLADDGTTIAILNDDADGLNEAIFRLFNEGSETIRFRASSNPNFINAGNLGIGTTSPSNLLDLNTDGASDYGIALSDDGTIVAHLYDAGDVTNEGMLRLYNEGVESVRVRASSGLTYFDAGNVGIGTTTPDGLLDVDGSISISGKASPTSGEQLEIFWLNSGAYFESYNYTTSEYRPINYSGSMHLFNADVRVLEGSFVDDGTTLSVPDYVFEPEYEMESIEEHAEYMWQKKHLPAVSSAKEINGSKTGYNMAVRREQMLEELEKAHVYIEQLNNAIKAQQKLNTEQQKYITEQQKQMQELQNQMKALKAEVKGN
jgi:hypothetical protein